MAIVRRSLAIFDPVDKEGQNAPDGVLLFLEPGLESSDTALQGEIPGGFGDRLWDRLGLDMAAKGKILFLGANPLRTVGGHIGGDGVDGGSAETWRCRPAVVSRPCA